jgi:hypothetical protein
LPIPRLIDPDDTGRPGPEQREQLRRHGPVRIVVRLGAEKGVTGLLAAPSGMPGRRTEVVVTPAAFEAVPGGQDALLAGCRALAQTAGASLLPPLAWRDVPRFLAGAAVTIVPSARETFGNLALESLSAGTPVIAHATGNLPPSWDRMAGSTCPWTRARLACGKLPGNCSAIRYATTRCVEQRTAGHGTTALLW